VSSRTRAHKLPVSVIGYAYSWPTREGEAAATTAFGALAVALEPMNVRRNARQAENVGRQGSVYHGVHSTAARSRCQQSERFQRIREELSKRGFNLPLPTGNWHIAATWQHARSASGTAFLSMSELCSAIAAARTGRRCVASRRSKSVGTPEYVYF